MVFKNAYPGIDLVVYGKNGWADYDFVVGPGARAEDIELDFGGAQSVELKSSGDVWLTSDGCHFRHLKPVIYQARERKRDIVDGGYVGRGTDGVGFEIGGHDSTRPLVIQITVDYRIRVVSPPRTGATVGPERVRTEP